VLREARGWPSVFRRGGFRRVRQSRECSGAIAPRRSHVPRKRDNRSSRSRAWSSS
jgi:hypothetical protein